MLVENDGLPKVGNQSKCLGVREPPSPNADVDIDSAGNVVIIQIGANKATPARTGLSVSDDWRRLPGHLIPKELDDGRNGATGKGLKVFVHGIGPFAEGLITHNLQMWYKLGTSQNGVVAPLLPVPLAAFQQDLAQTRQNWVVDPS